jgi:hypothetical protein
MKANAYSVTNAEVVLQISRWCLHWSSTLSHFYSNTPWHSSYNRLLCTNTGQHYLLFMTDGICSMLTLTAPSIAILASICVDRTALQISLWCPSLGAAHTIQLELRSKPEVTLCKSDYYKSIKWESILLGALTSFSSLGVCSRIFDKA